MIPIIAKSTVNLFAKLGIKFKLWHQGNGLEPCCGEPLIAFGLFADAKSIGTRIIDTVTHAKNVEALVTSCSGCYNTFINLYPKTIGIEFSGINIYHTSQLLADHISEISLKANKPLRIIYHDACSLGRHTNVYDAPRAVLDAIDGVERVELTMNREFSMCCGGGGGVWALNPKVAMKLATEKIISEALRLNADCIVTCCPLCALNFKRSIPKTRNPFPIYDLSEFVVRCI
jgi:Fe-S oxidoreductase